MKTTAAYKIIFSIITLIALVPALVKADPPGPGGTDPFGTPVNGYIAVVAVIAFVYGAYRMYQIAKKNSAGNAN